MGIKYKLIIKDYNEYFTQYEINELINLAKLLEKKEKTLNNNDLYKNEIKKIYQKIIDISTKYNKVAITLEYLANIKSHHHLLSPLIPP